MDGSSSEGKSKRPGPLWLIVGVVAAVGGFGIMQIAGAKGEAKQEAVAPPDTTPLVEAYSIQPAPRTYRVHAPGRLQPRDELQLVGEVAGKVVSINENLTPGGRIDQGAIVVRIDDGDYAADLQRARAQLATAQARLSQASSERDRQNRLSEIGAAPEKAAEAAVATFEDAQAAVKQAEAQVRIAERAVGKTVIRAPFDAIVTSENLALGTYVAPGQSLATLISADVGEVQAGLPADEIAAVRAAMANSDEGKLSVTAEPNTSSLSRVTLNGYVDDFSPLIDAASRTATLIAVFPDAFSEANEGVVFAGDYVDVLIEGYSENPVWSVPEGSVRQDSFVWVITDRQDLHKAHVDVIDQSGDMILVHSDELDGSQRVMTTVLSEEVEGMRVSVEGDRS